MSSGNVGIFNVKKYCKLVIRSPIYSLNIDVNVTALCHTFESNTVQENAPRTYVGLKSNATQPAIPRQTSWHCSNVIALNCSVPPTICIALFGVKHTETEKKCSGNNPLYSCINFTSGKYLGSH